MKTAEQAVYDALWQILEAELPGSVYESRPMNEVGYPFADFDGSRANYTSTKNGCTARISIDLNIWDMEYNRKKVSDIGEMLLREAMSLKDAFGYPVSLRINDSSIQMMQDRTVKPTLWRCMVNLVFEI